MPTNRARTKIGVGEEVTLTISPSSFGSVTWAVSGGGALSSTSGGSATFTAGDRAGTSTITARRADGCSCSLSFTVIEPSAVMIEQVSGSGIWHQQGTPSAGFKGQPYIQPTDVSFENIQVMEGSVNAVTSGYFTPQSGQTHPPTPGWASVGAVVAGKGSKLDGSDTIQGGDGGIGSPYSTGTFTWAIPWSYRVGTGSAKVFATATHVKSIDATGKLTISKGGTTVSKELNAASSTY